MKTAIPRSIFPCGGIVEFSYPVGDMIDNVIFHKRRGRAASRPRPTELATVRSAAPPAFTARGRAGRPMHLLQQTGD